MHTRTTTALGLAAAGLLLTACSSNSNGSRPDDTATPPATTIKAAATTPPPAPTPTATPTPGPYRLGQVWNWTGTQDGTVHGSSAALAYEQPAKTDAPSPQEAFGDTSTGYVWAYAEVKVCSKEGTFSASNQPWLLYMPDGARLTPSDTTYDGFPQPEFPVGDTVLTSGKCVRGKITYAVPGKVRPVSVVYSPDGVGDPVEWAVPGK